MLLSVSRAASWIDAVAFEYLDELFKGPFHKAGAEFQHFRAVIGNQIPAFKAAVFFFKPFHKFLRRFPVAGRFGLSAAAGKVA
jgi:hypothetical protein